MKTPILAKLALDEKADRDHTVLIGVIGSTDAPRYATREDINRLFGKSDYAHIVNNKNYNKHMANYSECIRKLWEIGLLPEFKKCPEGLNNLKNADDLLNEINFDRDYLFRYHKEVTESNCDEVIYTSGLLALSRQHIYVYDRYIFERNRYLRKARSHRFCIESENTTVHIESMSGKYHHLLNFTYDPAMMLFPIKPYPIKHILRCLTRDIPAMIGNEYIIVAQPAMIAQATSDIELIHVAIPGFREKSPRMSAYVGPVGGCLDYREIYLADYVARTAFRIARYSFSTDEGTVTFRALMYDDGDLFKKRALKCNRMVENVGEYKYKPGNKNTASYIASVRYTIEHAMEVATSPIYLVVYARDGNYNEAEDNTSWQVSYMPGDNLLQIAAITRMIFDEAQANRILYGAETCDEALLDVASTVDDDVSLDWTPSI